MTITFSLELNYRADSSGQHLIQIRCSQNRKHKRFTTGISVPLKSWDKQKQKIKKNHPNNEQYTRIIEAQMKQLCERYAKLLETTEDVILDDLLISPSKTKQSFFSFAATTKIAAITSTNKLGTLRRYESVLNKFKAFAGEKLPVDRVTYELVKKYEHHLLTVLHNTRDTVSSNLSVIRTIINEAIRHGYYDKKNPFDQIQLKYTDSTKEKLTAEELNRFKNVMLPKTYSVNLARDFFMACFYTEGCRGGDMIMMRHTHIVNGCFDYYQQKTGKRMIVPISQHLHAIIDQYRTESEYIFPLIRPEEKVNEIIVGSKLAYINKYLKEVGKYAGVFKKISTHCARHTFTDLALVATDNNMYQVQKYLGHSSVKTTEHYARNRVSYEREAVIDKIIKNLDEQK